MFLFTSIWFSTEAGFRQVNYVSLYTAMDFESNVELSISFLYSCTNGSDTWISERGKSILCLPIIWNMQLQNIVLGCSELSAFREQDKRSSSN